MHVNIITIDSRSFKSYLGTLKAQSYRPTQKLYRLPTKHLPLQELKMNTSDNFFLKPIKWRQRFKTEKEEHLKYQFRNKNGAQKHLGNIERPLADHLS